MAQARTTARGGDAGRLPGFTLAACAKFAMGGKVWRLRAEAGRAFLPDSAKGLLQVLFRKLLESERVPLLELVEIVSALCHERAELGEPGGVGAPGLFSDPTETRLCPHSERNGAST